MKSHSLTPAVTAGKAGDVLGQAVTGGMSTMSGSAHTAFFTAMPSSEAHAVSKPTLFADTANARLATQDVLGTVYSLHPTRDRVHAAAQAEAADGMSVPEHALQRAHAIMQAHKLQQAGKQGGVKRAALADIDTNAASTAEATAAGAGAAASSSQTNHALPGLSGAEAARQARIAANMARMRELGLQGLGAALQPPAPKKPRVAEPKPKAQAPAEASRKSSRPPTSNPKYALMPGEMGSHAHLSDAVPWKRLEHKAFPDFLPDVPMYEASFGSSLEAPVLKGREVGANAQLDKAYSSLHPWAWQPGASAAMEGFNLPYCSLGASPINDVGAVATWGRLLAVGGNAGRGASGCAAIYGLPDMVEAGSAAAQAAQATVAPLHSCRLGDSTIVGLSFMPRSTGYAHSAEPADAGAREHADQRQVPWLATASTKGTVAIWDTGLSDRAGCFAPVLKPTKMHAGAISSMHAAAAQPGSLQLLTTCERDHKVKLSQLKSDGGIQVVRDWSATGFPRCVRWRDPHEAAVAGCSSFKSVFRSDKRGEIALLDTRSPDPTRLPTAYYGPNIVNTLRWAVSTHNGDGAPATTATPAPLAESYGPAPHLLLCTTWGASVRVFDVRNTARHYASLEGHNIEGNVTTHWLKADFAWGGRGVVAEGYPKKRISFYDLTKVEEWPEAHGFAANKMLDEVLEAYHARPKNAPKDPVKYAAPSGMVSQVEIRGGNTSHMCVSGHIVALVSRNQATYGGCVLRASFVQ